MSPLSSTTRSEPIFFAEKKFGSGHEGTVFVNRHDFRPFHLQDIFDFHEYPPRGFVVVMKILFYQLYAFLPNWTKNWDSEAMLSVVTPMIAICNK
jgi:hypothetical protein